MPIGARIGPRLTPGNARLGAPKSSLLGTVTRDATSLVYRPATLLEWQSFISAKGLPISTPDYLHVCQEASGNLADPISSLTLTASGTVAYQTAVAGWATKGVAFNGIAAGAFANAVGPDISTTNVAILSFVAVRSVPATACSIMSINGDACNLRTRNTFTQGLNFRYAAGNTNMVAANADGTVRPMLLRSDLTNSVAKYYSDLEATASAFSAPAAGTAYTLGLGTTDTAGADAVILYSVGWKAAKVAQLTDANVRALYSALGFSPAW